MNISLLLANRTKKQREFKEKYLVCRRCGSRQVRFRIEDNKIICRMCGSLRKLKGIEEEK